MSSERQDRAFRDRDPKQRAALATAGLSRRAQALLVRLRGLPVGSAAVALTLIVMAAGSLAYRFGAMHVALYVLIGASAWLRLGMAITPATSWREAAILSELATLPLVAVWLASSAFGADAPLVFPLGLIVVASAAARLDARSARIAAVVALLLAVAQWIGFGSWRGLVRDLVAQVVYISGFFAAGTFLVRPGILSRESDGVARERRDSAAETFKIESRDLAEDMPRANDQEGRLEALGRLCESILGLGRLALSAHSGVLMLRDLDDVSFRVFRFSTSEPELIGSNGVRQDVGFLGAVVRSQAEVPALPAIRLADLDAGQAMLPYYTRTPARIRAAIGVPFRLSHESGTVDGVVFFDRTAGPSFDDVALELAVTVSRLLRRSLEHERGALAAAARVGELENLLGSLAAISTSFEPQPAFAAILAAVDKLIPLRFGALVRRTDDGFGRVVAVHGEEHTALLDATIPVTGSATALALRNTTAVPPTRRWAASHGALLAPSIGPRPADGDSAFAVPLIASGKIVGALVLVAKDAIEDGTTSQFDALVQQIASRFAHTLVFADLQEKATTDGLTGLDNRPTLMTRLHESLARSARSVSEVAVLALDLDHFKQVNDVHGHPIGDLVLRKVAKILSREKRVNDTAARLGGEEFVVVLEQTTHDGAMVAAERIRRAVADLKIPTDKGEVTITVSIGIAVAPDDGINGPDLIKRADAALYRAKSAGRNQVKLFARRAAPAGGADGSADDGDGPSENG